MIAEEVEKMLSERDMNLLVQCAADRDEKSARNFGPEGVKFYNDLVKQMEEDKKNGVKGTYSIPPSYD